MIFRVIASAKLCQCESDGKTLGTHNKLTRAVVTAQAHWSIYISFWGDKTHWIDMLIVDTRDGVVMWSNGQLTPQGRERIDGESAAKGRDRPGAR